MARTTPIMTYSKGGKFIRRGGRPDTRRANTRIQIFDQEGKHLATWHQFGMPSRASGSATPSTAGVKYFILDQGGNPGTTTGSGAEFGTVDKFGNVFTGEPRPRVLRKYVKVR